MWDNKYTKMRCDRCGKFIKQAYDILIPFGCTDPEAPEPLPEQHFCKDCYEEEKIDWDNSFKRGNRNGDWQKSRAEKEMAKKHKLVWAGVGGIGILGTKYFLKSYQYYPENVYETFSKLPYYGWCLKCGAIIKNGYCSNDKCEDSFDNKK